MITIHIVPDEATRTKERTCEYVASAEINGRTYHARSRYSAANEMARVLMAEGIRDSRVRVTYDRLAGYTEYPSLHAMSRYTYSEGRTSPVHRIVWRDFEEIYGI